MDKSRKKTNIELLLLTVLINRDMYGFEIINKVTGVSKGSFSISEGTLYSTLKRLEAKGCILSYWGDESDGGRRKYYQLTPLGRQDQENKLAHWKEINMILDTILEKE